MLEQKVAELPKSTSNDEPKAALKGYVGDGVELAGREGALYDNHLLFDHLAQAKVANARERYEAFARSIRDVLSERWARTEGTYRRENPKRIYYLSMEFLIGRSLANNVTNLMLDSVTKGAIQSSQLDWVDLLEQEPDAGLGNGGLGRLAACFLDSMATLQLPATGDGLRYEYGMFRQSIRDGWQFEQPDNWLRFPDPWEVPRPHESVEVKLNCSFDLRGGGLRAVPGRPSSLIGIPYDRPVVGYGGRTVNTLRLWDAITPDYFDFAEFSKGDFAGALVETLAADSLTRVLYPDYSTSMGQGLRFVQEYFLVACSLADLIRRFRLNNDDWDALPQKAAIQLNDTHPAMAVCELMRILLDEAKLEWDQAWDVTRRTLAYTNHTLLPEALEKWPLEWFEMLLAAKSQFVDWLSSSCGISVDPDSIFDCQVKRIHEYKRQLLNALRIVVLYNRLRKNPGAKVASRTFVFAGKAAPAYRLAKLIIKFINNLASTIDGDSTVGGRLKVVFVPDYCVTIAERLIPASDVSNQISTAGYEASGTSNMKFMMNGALTIGTRDGATIEMAEEAGEENFFLIGLTSDQVTGQRGSYSPYLALRARSGNSRSSGPDRQRPLQSKRAGSVRPDIRNAS